MRRNSGEQPTTLPPRSSNVPTCASDSAAASLRSSADAPASPASAEHIPPGSLTRGQRGDSRLAVGLRQDLDHESVAEEDRDRKSPRPAGAARGRDDVQLDVRPAALVGELAVTEANVAPAC